MSKVILLCNQKGGVGKTTTTVNLGAGLAREGKRVLLIDGDPEAHLTFFLGYAGNYEACMETGDLFAGGIRKSAYNAIKTYRHKEGFHLIPASEKLTRYNIELAKVPDKYAILKYALQHIRDQYDFVLIDGMPSFELITVNELVAADSVIITTQPHPASANGLQKLLRKITQTQSQIHPGLTIEGILMTMVDSRTIINREIPQLIRDTYGGELRIFQTQIPFSVRAQEIVKYGESIFAYQPKCKLALAYKKFTQEVLNNG